MSDLGSEPMGGRDLGSEPMGGRDLGSEPMGGRSSLVEVDWQRLHPLSAAVRAGRLLGAFVVFVAVGSLQQGGSAVGDLVRLGVVGLAVVGGLISWLVTRWRLAGGVLEIRAGLLRRTSERFPLARIQAVDVVRPGLARVLGLSELRVRMAGGKDTTGRLAYLREAEAAQLRGRLLALAHGLQEATPPPPEEALWTVPTGRLVASLLLTAPALLLEAALVALAVLALAAPRAAAAAFGVSATVLLGSGTALLRRFNGEYRLTVAHAPDGIRVRSGLVETSAETIPAGRVQAVRLVQPLTWRPFGWVRLEVDVAGRADGGRRDRSSRHASGVLLPVGDRQLAARLTERVLPGFPRPDPSRRPPRRAAWKTPLRYRHLAWSSNGRYVSASAGRVRLVTDVVPLAKVQSVRRVQGPVQRRFHLASIHLDTAGRNVRAVLRDRDEREADQLVDDLPGACRAARTS